MFTNQFGHFDATGKTFVVTDPRTPMPWVNVVCNGRYGFVASQNGGGFSWLDNSQLNVLTRWEMDLARDVWGRFLYAADRDSGELWSLAPSPVRPDYERYRCEHTPGSTTIETRCSGIEARWTMAVPPEDTCEVWRVTLTNDSGRRRRLRLSSYFEWCCGTAPDAKREFHRLFFTVSHDPARKAIIARKNMWDAPSPTKDPVKKEKEHWNRPWPYVAGHAVHGPFEADLAIADKKLFLGRYGQLERPRALLNPAAEVGGFGRFGDAAAALGGDLTLEPGQTATVVYILAIADDGEALETLIDRYRAPGAADRAIEAAGGVWDRLLSSVAVRSDMPDFDLLNSCWLPYQAISGRLWARTGYYQQSGAFGFRDQLQDSQVWLPRDPARTKQQILLHAAHQFADGSVYHWWHPLAEFGLRTLCSDDYLWLPFLAVNYIKETGDHALLDERAPFVDDGAGATLLEHCKRSIARSFARMSPRGLPLIGSCDWNDGLSALGVEGRGESVWLAQFLALILNNFATLVERRADLETAQRYRKERERLIAALERHAWDGAWYRAATADDGRWLGTRDPGGLGNGAGTIFLNTQTWAILAETAPLEREDQAWASVKEHLLADMGPLLSTPAFTEPDGDIGYITRYAPGLRENGGVYMHAATWALAAACKRRDVGAIESIWRSISPPLRSSREGGDAEAYVAEPYVTPGNVDGPDSATPGKAGWTWYTGSAAWLHRVSLEWILGVRPTWEGLVIDPCPFPSLGRVEATRLWRGREVRLSFDSREFSAALPPRLTVNGVEHAGTVIAPGDHPGDRPLEIRVTWSPVRTVSGAGGGGGAGGRSKVGSGERSAS